ncbi:MAG: quinoprotein dehydrogenase-associated SoxYZ-like carrier [Pseudomonadota bacterium]
MRSVNLAALALALSVFHAHAEEIKNPLKDGESWTYLREEVVGDATILDGASLFTVDAPYRAHDAATVPVHIKQNPTSGEQITRLTIVVDENPAPVVAEFNLEDGIGHLDLETRVRIDQYSNLRVIAETAGGKTYMNGRFVKASGGCSAPALKDMDSSLAAAGKMRLKVFDAAASENATIRQQAQVMIRHPNYSGMQRNQLTQLFIPAFFIQEMQVFQGEEKLFSMEGGISISEDPVFRFSYIPNQAGVFRVVAEDTDGNRYEKEFTIGSDT